MAHTFKTLSDGDITRLCLESFRNNLVFAPTINQQYDARFAKEGAKNGGTLLIRNPNEYIVTTGATMDLQDVTESTQTLTVATQKHVALSFTSVEETMYVDDFQQRFIDPAMARLAADYEDTLLSNMYKDVFNLTGTPATTPASLAAALNAGARLTQGLAPDSNRHLLFDPLAMAATVASVSAYFHKGSSISTAYSKGYIGEASGFKWHESAMVPSHTNGSRDDTTPVCDISTISNGDTTLTTTGFDNGATLTAGDVFTVADVYDVNLETKAAYSHLKQFTVRTAKTCDGTDVIDIAPTIYKSGARQNCYASAWTGSKALVSVAAGGSGAASTAYVQNLAYHRDAFTTVMADLVMPFSGVAYRTQDRGIAMRYWKSSDIVNDKHPVRIDILFGYKTIRPEWAVRVRG